MNNNELSTTFKEVTGKDFNEFYKNYRPKLVYYLTKYTKNQELSEDFADDAFTQALLKIKNFNSDKAQIHTWVYKIGENLVIKDFNDKKKFSTVSIDKNNDDNLNMSNLLSYDYGKEIEEELLLQKKTEIIKDAIYKLPEKYKQVMVLRELKRMSYVAISETCVKNFDMVVDGVETLPSPNEFLDLKIHNTTNDTCSVMLSIKNEKVLLDVKQGEEFYLDNEEISNITNIDIISKSPIGINYRVITNLATIKSQIRAGRELIRNMIKHKFAQLDMDGIE